MKKKISIERINIDILILINEIIKNTQEKYADNYFYNININHLLKSFSKSQNDEIKQLFQIAKNDNNNEKNFNEIIIKKENINENKLNLVSNSNSEDSENNIKNNFITKEN